MKFPVSLSNDVTLVKTFNAIDVKISNGEIEACHRFSIKKKMFTIDLQCLSALRNRKKLRFIDDKENNLPYSRFFFSENLTPMNSETAFICRELRRDGFFQNICTVNGIVNISEDRVEKSYENIS